MKRNHIFIYNKIDKQNLSHANQLTVRDWNNIINQIAPDKIIKVPSNIYLEGGDIIVDNKTIYVGISERTTIDAITFLKDIFGEKYSIIPLKLKPKFK